jgi:uncharacterized metal-binding protein YceD (DUF177 family)
MDTAPFNHPFDLSALTERAEEESFSIPEGARAAVAAWLEIDGLDALDAHLRLWRLSANEYAVEGRFRADIRQTCIVTLVPLMAHIEGDIARRYRTLPMNKPRRAPAEPGREAAMDDETDSIKGHMLDLAMPVLEELSLAINPYPRAPGAEFGALPDPEEEREENPFAVLEKLKGSRLPPGKT